MLENKARSTDARAGLDRRSVMRGAAWSVPVIALAIATPAHAASTVDVGAFALRGTCGTIGILGPGFWLDSSTTPLPAGTTITITGSGVANIGDFSVSGGTAIIVILSPTSRLVTLTSVLPSAAAMSFRTTLSLSEPFQLNAVASLPDEYSGTGAKTAAQVSNDETLCSAS